MAANVQCAGGGWAGEWAVSFPIEDPSPGVLIAGGHCPRCGGQVELIETSGAEAGVSAGSASVPESCPEAAVPTGRLDLDPIRRWYGQAPAVTAAQRLTRSHVGYLLDEVDEVRAIEMAALVLLRASGPDASWGEHEVAEHALGDLLAARGHEVGERVHERDLAERARAEERELLLWRRFGQALAAIWPEMPRRHSDAVRYLRREAAELERLRRFDAYARQRADVPGTPASVEHVVVDFDRAESERS
jgi:hypothetical protein